MGRASGAGSGARSGAEGGGSGASSGAGSGRAGAHDAGSGRQMWSVRTGTGALMNNHYAAITIAPDGSLWIATLAGLVRVRDRG